MKTVAGIDTGTQSTKVLIYDYEGQRIVAQASAAHELISRTDGTREQEASWWIRAIGSCFEQIPQEIRTSIEAVGVSGQQHGFVPVDAQGEVLYPVKLWCDTSTAAECTELTEAFGGSDALLERVGNLVLPGYTASKILWLKHQHPEVYERMAKILLPHDYINWYLTGAYTMEPGDASGTALLSIEGRTWNTELMTALDPQRDLLACLPRLIDSREPAGRVTERAAAEFGIPAGIPVSSGGGDNMMGAIGTGTVAPGVLTMSLGTSGTIYGYSETPVIDPNGALAAFCSSTGGWLPLLCTMNCTVASELTRALLSADLGSFDAQAERAAAGSQGVIMLPFFNGERTPNFPHGKGCIVGMDATNMREENIARAAMESAIFGLKTGLDAFIALGYRPKEVRLIGGGANSPLWRQIAADILDLPVVIPQITEAAAFGAALQALWCMNGLSGDQEPISTTTDEHVVLDPAKGCSPSREAVSTYQRTYAVYSSYVEALTGLFS